MGYLYYFSCIKPLKSGMYVVSTASKSQFRLATFQTLSRHMWLVASILDSAVLNQASGCPACTQACVSTKKMPWSPRMGHGCSWYGDLAQRWPYHNSGQGCSRWNSFPLQSHVLVTGLRAAKTRGYFWIDLYFQCFLHLALGWCLSRMICMGSQSDSLK